MKSHSTVGNYVRASLAMVSLIFATASQAAIFDRISPSPASRDISTNQVTSLTVNWNIVSSHATTANLDLTSASQSLVIEDSFGNQLAIVSSGPLSATVALPQATRVTTTFTETIIVTSDMVRKARANRSNRVVIKRRFNGSLLETGGQGKVLPISATAIGSINLNISTSSTTTDLSISRLSLTFDNGLLSSTLARDSKLKARLELQTHGIGVVRGVWEIAEPPTTRGTPFFRPLTQVSKHVVGEDSFVLMSPDLPTNWDGLYLLRFRLLEPALDMVPMVRYMVSPASKAEQVKLLPIDLRQPADKSYLKKNTEFSWQHIQGAKYYQLELFESPAPSGLNDVKLDLAKARRVAGVLILGKNQKQILSDLTRRHFNSGYHYYWHVIAIDGDGNRIARSELRKVIMP